MERFKLRKLSELEVSKQYHIKITNMFAALENVNESENINRAWENIKENIKTSATETVGLYESKQHKPSFDEECLCSLYKRKQVKTQWLQDPNQISVDNLNNVKREASRHFWNIKTEYLKTKIDELEINNMIKNIRDLHRGINDLRRVTRLELIQ